MPRNDYSEEAKLDRLTKYLAIAVYTELHFVISLQLCMLAVRWHLRKSEISLIFLKVIVKTRK